MTNEPDNRNLRPAQPTKAKQTDAPAAGQDSKKMPAEGTPIHDPAGHEYGDRVDDESKAMIPGDDDAMSKNSRERRDGDMGDGHKGARGEPKQGQSDKREHNEPSTAGHHAQPKPNAAQGAAKMDPKASPSKDASDSKVHRPQGGASGR
ncbi:MAG: hypothetical protein JNN27_14330 [Planctomycetes bacterium]|nr:hypothetical protein [Planctomycetota bacterium]